MLRQFHEIAVAEEVQYLLWVVTSMLAPPGKSSTSFCPPMEVSVTEKVSPRYAMSPCGGGIILVSFAKNATKTKIYKHSHRMS